MNQGKSLKPLCVPTIENEQLDAFLKRGERVENIDSSQNLTGLCPS
jgi:hypothetical protein